MLYDHEEHALKSVFRKQKIPQIEIAIALKKSPALINHWLNGLVPIPPPVEEHLQELAQKANSKSI